MFIGDQFPDGSALITYLDGSMLILESNLAKESVWHESGPVNYNDPPRHALPNGEEFEPLPPHDPRDFFRRVSVEKRWVGGVLARKKGLGF